MRLKPFAILFAIILGLCLVFCACVEDPEDEDRGGDVPPNYEQNDDGEQPEDPDDGEREDITEMYITVKGNSLKVTLEQNSSVDALVEILKKGDITYTAYPNGFEIYGDIGHSLPTNNSEITSETGDVLLWAGSNICIFFGNNSYSYTRIGKISGYSSSELRALLGAGQGSVQVTISLK